MKFLLALVLSSVYLFSMDAFISPKDLRQLMTQKNVVLIDATNLETFNEGHIPGAVRADISDFRHGVEAYQRIFFYDFCKCFYGVCVSKIIIEIFKF